MIAPDIQFNSLKEAQAFLNQNKIPTQKSDDTYEDLRLGLVPQNENGPELLCYTPINGTQSSCPQQRFVIKFTPDGIDYICQHIKRRAFS